MCDCIGSVGTATCCSLAATLAVGNDAGGADILMSGGQIFVNEIRPQNTAPLLIGYNNSPGPSAQYVSIIATSSPEAGGASLDLNPGGLSGADPAGGSANISGGSILPGNPTGVPGAVNISAGAPSDVGAVRGANVELLLAGRPGDLASSGLFRVKTYDLTLLELGEEARLDTASAGDMLILDPSKRATWANPGLVVGFNYVIDSRARLATLFPPVAGVFTLPSGSYAITNEVALSAGENIVTAASSFVTIYGKFGTPGRITGNTATDLLATGANASLVLYSMRVQQTGAGRAVDVAAGGAAKFFGCNISSTSGVALRAAAFVQSFGTRFSGSTHTIQLTSEMWSVGDAISGGTTTAVELTGAGTLRATNSEISGNAAGRSIIANSTGYVYLIGVRVNTGLIALELLAASELRIVGGSLSAVAGNPALRIAGNVDYIDVQTLFAASSAGVLYVSGTVGLARFIGCGFTSTSATGINWAAANVPARGLIETNNSFNLTAANAFVGHTQTDARVMRRANTLAAGAFASETSIVP